uniref:Uncharacterized protein n=1 Tax=Arundo donax TaxID=35708 RepID=A0A0A9AJP3_ARUDO
MQLRYPSTHPSKDSATPEKFFATNLCKSSPAQLGIYLY